MKTGSGYLLVEEGLRGCLELISLGPSIQIGQVWVDVGVCSWRSCRWTRPTVENFTNQLLRVLFRKAWSGCFRVTSASHIPGKSVRTAKTPCNKYVIDRFNIESPNPRIHNIVVGIHLPWPDSVKNYQAICICRHKKWLGYNFTWTRPRSRCSRDSSPTDWERGVVFEKTFFGPDDVIGTPLSSDLTLYDRGKVCVDERSKLTSFIIVVVDVLVFGNVAKTS